MKEVIIREGKVRVSIVNPIYYLRRDRVIEPTWSEVFYNPLMTFNRDFSVLVLDTYFKLNNLRGDVLDALSGTGIRAIRYYVETEALRSSDSCIANDISPKAVEGIVKNVRLNKLTPEEIRIFNEDANALMYRSKRLGLVIKYVDIDPFGSAAPFVTSSINSVVNNGLIGITSTDVATLSGIKVSACRRRYGVVINRTVIPNEVCLRVLLGFIAREALKFDRGIEVLISMRRLYYCRVFIKVLKSSSKANEVLLKHLGYLQVCNNCSFINYVGIDEVSTLSNLSIKCPTCGNRLNLVGPLWIGNLGSTEFINSLLSNLKKKYRYLQTYRYIKDQLEILKREVTLNYTYNVATMARFRRMNQPKLSNLVECLNNMGYEAYKAHYNSKYIKTNAPHSKLLECLEEVTDT